MRRKLELAKERTKVIITKPQEINKESDGELKPRNIKFDPNIIKRPAPRRKGFVESIQQEG